MELARRFHWGQEYTIWQEVATCIIAWGTCSSGSLKLVPYLPVHTCNPPPKVRLRVHSPGKGETASTPRTRPVWATGQDQEDLRWVCEGSQQIDFHHVRPTHFPNRPPSGRRAPGLSGCSRLSRQAPWPSRKDWVKVLLQNATQPGGDPIGWRRNVQPFRHHFTAHLCQGGFPRGYTAWGTPGGGDLPAAWFWCELVVCLPSAGEQQREAGDHWLQCQPDHAGAGDKING